jgi:hypothetical protein
MWLLGEAGVNQNNNKYQRFVKWFIKRAREIQNGYKKMHYLKNVKSKRNDFVGYYWDSKQSWLIYKKPMGKVLTKKA